MTDWSFPTGTFSAEVFCGLVLGRRSFQDAQITRLDWLQKDSWPLYHQYLLAEATHNGRIYELRIETLGKVDRSRMVVQALGLSGLRAGSLGTAKFQVQVLEITGDSQSADFIDHDPPANLITSMGGVDDPLFRNFETFAADSDDWYFTAVLPPDLSQVEARDPPTVGHLCRVLSSILNRAPDYTIEAQNCYFLCHMVMLGLSELCAPLPRLTWTLYALYRPVDLDTKVPWHRRVRGPTARLLTLATSSILYVDGLPSDHLRAIIIDGWGLGGVSSFYQGIQIHNHVIMWAIIAFVPPIICGAIWGRKRLWVGCMVPLAVVITSQPAASGHISIKFPERAFTSEDYMLQSLNTFPESILRPPVDITVGTSTSGFPTGTFSAHLFCNMVLSRPNLRGASITRIDWLRKNSWPLYHQYLLVEISYDSRIYLLKIETLGKVDRYRAVAQTLALNALGAGFSGDGKFQVEVWEQSANLSAYEFVKQNSANLIVSLMANEAVATAFLSSIFAVVKYCPQPCKTRTIVASVSFCFLSFSFFFSFRVLGKLDRSLNQLKTVQASILDDIGAQQPLAAKPKPSFKLKLIALLLPPISETYLRSMREAERKNRQTDLAPTPLADEPIPKGIARVLGAESVRAAYKERRRKEEEEEAKGKRLNSGEGVRPGETLREFNRRVEETHRPLVRAAMKHSGKGKEKEPAGAVAVKRKREQADEDGGEQAQPVKEFQTVSSSAPKRLHDVALAPPTLTSAPRGVKKVPSKGTISMARQVVLEKERERLVAMYRAHKARVNSNLGCLRHLSFFRTSRRLKAILVFVPMSTTFTLPSFSSGFDSMSGPAHAASPRSSHSHSGPSRSSRSHSPRQYATQSQRPWPESNTRTATRDDRERPTRKRPAPADDDAELPPPRATDNDGDIGMRSDRDQDGDDESSGGSSPSLPHVAVKEEQLSEVEQSPSPPPTPAGTTRSTRPLPPGQQRYAHPSGSGPQTHFAPTPPASARRVSPPHIALPLLPHAHAGSSSMTLPPLNFPPPSPSHTHHQHPPYQPPSHSQGYTHTEPMLARKRRRVTISGVAANTTGPPPRPLHRTVLERAGSGYGHAQTHLPPPPGANTGPTTPNPASGMVSPVVTPGFNMNSPGALDQVRDTIAIRMEQKALIEQRKNGGGGLAGVPAPAAPPIRSANPAPGQPSRTQGSPAGQSTHLPPNTLHAPTTSPSQGPAPPPLTSSTSAPGQLSSHASADPPPALSAPPQQTQTLAHRRGKASKLTIHTPNTSMSSSHGGSIGNAAGLGLTGTDRPGDAPGRGLGPLEVAIRSAPPNVTRFDPNIGRPPPTHGAHRPPPQPTPLKERTVPIRRMHANSTAAPNTPSAPLAIVAPGQPLTLNAPAPPSSYIATPTRAQFPPSSQTPHHPHHPHLTPRTTTRGPGPASPPISRSAFMAFYDAYAEVHMLRAQMERMEREMNQRMEFMRDEVRMLRDEIRRGHEAYYGREYGRGEPGPSRPPAPHRAGIQRSGSISTHHSPMQVDKLPLPPMDKDRQHLVRDKSMDRLHPHPRPVLRKSPSGRVQSSMSPPSRPPSVGPGPSAGEAGAKTRSSGKGRRSKSPGSKSNSG
ncbi:hypothetical protein FRC07_008772 [Ceratobasidium sp. 392]|nr:hypothetical protein FRC07_008772 [Ceratobasidium sp. 392]